MIREYSDSSDILYKYEEKYVNELRKNPIKLLREIKVSKEEIDEIAKHINIVYKSNSMKSLRIRFPVTVSLFLVWCTVYEYKDGDMWSNIFEKLNISSSIKQQVFLGDIFLNTINNYDLMQVKEGEGKKYLSPILMHGYISNHYAYDLFDYLNKIYSIVLEEDTSEVAINEIWDDIFSEHIDLKNIRKERIILEEKRQRLIDEKRYYDEIDDDTKSIDYKYVEDLELEVNNLEKLIELNKEKIEKVEEKTNINEKINNQIIDIDTTISKLYFKSNIGLRFSDLNEINSLVSDVNKLLKDKNNNLIIDKENLVKEIKGLNNRLAVRKEALISIKTKISTLGQGNLDRGWLILEEYKKLIKEIKSIELEIKKNLKHENIVVLETNTTAKQILTASLNNLMISDPEYFKNLITRTIQMFGLYFSEGEIDTTHPLYDIFIEWTNRKPEIEQYTGGTNTQPIRTRQHTRRRLVLQRMKKPYMQFDTNGLLLNIIIPEQSFTFNIDVYSKPCYTLIEKSGKEIKLDIDYIYENQNLYIKEMKVPINSNSYEYLLFEWHNLKESHNISLDEIMIIDELGKFINGYKVRNGYYYIICNKTWDLDRNIIVNEHGLLFDDYKLLEIYLYENKAIFYSEDGKDSYELIATNYNIGYLSNYNPIEGIYVNNTFVATGLLPELIINYIGINPSEVYLNILIDDCMTFQRGLDYFVDNDKYLDKNSILKVDMYKLLKFWKYKTAIKLKIILSYINGINIIEEEFYYLPRIKFTYTSEGLKVRLGEGMRITNKGYKQNGVEYLVPLKNVEGENFEIFYDNYGLIRFWVEVPSVNARLVDEFGMEYLKEDILYGSKREKIKNLFVQFEAKSTRVKSILLIDNNNYLETILHMKGGMARTSIEPYFDIFNSEEDGQLFYKIEDKYVLTEKELLLKVYSKWEASNIVIHQKEEDDEYILGIDYDENFSFNGTKYLEVINDNQVIIKKEIKDQIYIYIKKKDLISNKIAIVISYEEQYESVFGNIKEAVIAGKVDVALKSRLDDIKNILCNGISAKEFKYEGETYKFKYPLKLGPISKANSKNFKDEEIYMTNIYDNGNMVDVYFYIDTESKTIPFLIDDEFDGAQYDPRTGRVFWELSTNKEIMGPIEHIKFALKGEE